jgi:hypothetical protein
MYSHDVRRCQATEFLEFSDVSLGQNPKWMTDTYALYMTRRNLRTRLCSVIRIQ